MFRDPALIVSLLRQGARRHGGAIASNDGDLVLRSDGLLRAARGTLGALAALAAAAGLREERLDPGLVDEVEGAGEGGEEEEVEEDATRCVLVLRFDESGVGLKGLHLGIKNAGCRLDNADGLVVGLELIDIALAGENGDDLEAQLLRVHVGGEEVRHALGAAGGNLHAILGAREIADDGGGGMRARRQGLQ